MLRLYALLFGNGVRCVSNLAHEYCKLDRDAVILLCTISGVSFQDLEDIYKRDLPKVKAYVNYKSRGIQSSTPEEQTADWENALAEIDGATLMFQLP